MTLGYSFNIIKNTKTSLSQKIMDSLGILDRAFKLIYPDTSYKNRDVYSFPHEKVVEAFRRGDPGECEKSVRMHIQYSK